MSRLNKILILSLIFISTISSCDDIFEEDISNESIDLISPLDESVVEGNFVTLQWQAIGNVDNYRLEIKSEVTGFIIDTLSLENVVSIPLSAGDYSWKVRGENSAYQTDYSFERSFSMIDVNDLSDQIIFLNSPDINLFLQSDDLILDWEEINVATGYELLIDRIIDGQQENIVNDTEVMSPPYLVDENLLMSDGSYKWSIKAVNEESESSFSNRFFFIDNQEPLIPTLISPENEELLNTIDSIALEWMIPEDIGEIQSEIVSFYELSNDENFMDIIESNDIPSESSSIEIQALSTGTYYWRVRLFDEASNQGEWSAIRSFTID